MVNTTGDLYVTDYYTNKYVVRITLSDDIDKAQLFHGKSASGHGAELDSHDTYGTHPNYVPSVTVYHAIKAHKWFLSHKSMFFNIQGNILYEENGKKRNSKFNGIENKKLEIKLSI